jgi:hypothetical protein
MTPRADRRKSVAADDAMMTAMKIRPALTNDACDVAAVHVRFMASRLSRGAVVTERMWVFS